jgi:ATP-dependent RNA helicase DeaD
MITRATLTVPETEQRYFLVHESSKLAALTRLLEVEDSQSVLIFARTKVGAAELAEALLARGYPAEALHGDLSQEARETVLRRFRKGQLAILVATDVMARGVDIPQVSHVINYDIPFDPEDYVHRIGRTGRAGRSGVALTLITPREQRRLKSIEAFTRQRMTRASLPEPAEVLARREARFAVRLNDVFAETDLSEELRFVQELAEEGHDVTEIAAAAIRLARAGESQRPIEDVVEIKETARRAPKSRDRREYHERSRASVRARHPRENGHEPGMVRLLLNVGREHGVQPGDVVAAIAGGAGIPGRAIGAIDIHRQQTYVDVRDIHADHVLQQMGRGKVRGQPVMLVRANDN